MSAEKVCFVYSVRPGVELRTRFFWSTSGSILRGIEKSLKARSITVPEKVTKAQYEAARGPVSNEARLILRHYNIALEEPTDAMKLWRMKNARERQANYQNTGKASGKKHDKTAQAVVEA